MNAKQVTQKILVLLILLVIPAFVLMNFPILRAKRDLPIPIARLESLIEENEAVEKAFVFVLYSVAEPKNAEQSLTSLLHQKYENFRIIILATKNMGSVTDSLKQLAAKENKLHLITVIESNDKAPSIDSFCSAVDACQNEEIIVQIDCNDWLANESVLTTLNTIYCSSDDVWLTYSQYLEYPSYRKGTAQPYLKKMLRNKYMRKTPWLSAHLKTYYAGLFKQIRSMPQGADLNDLELYMAPMAEHSKQHIRYIDDVLYVHSTGK